MTPTSVSLCHSHLRGERGFKVSAQNRGSPGGSGSISTRSQGFNTSYLRVFSVLLGWRSCGETEESRRMWVMLLPRAGSLEEGFSPMFLVDRAAVDGHSLIAEDSGSQRLTQFWHEHLHMWFVGAQMPCPEARSCLRLPSFPETVPGTPCLTLG